MAIKRRDNGTSALLALRARLQQTPLTSCQPAPKGPGAEVMDIHGTLPDFISAWSELKAIPTFPQLLVSDMVTAEGYHNDDFRLDEGFIIYNVNLLWAVETSSHLNCAMVYNYL